jgi:hypothetical protein
MSSLATKPYFDVERRTSDPKGWYQVMLAPFKTFEECLEYIQKYSQYYPPEQQNYRITYHKE